MEPKREGGSFEIWYYFPITLKFISKLLLPYYDTTILEIEFPNKQEGGN